LEEKPKIDDAQEPAENAEIKDANLAKSAEEMDKGLFIHRTTMAFVVIRQFQANDSFYKCR
jgi:hypothetical protein